MNEDDLAHPRDLLLGALLGVAITAAMLVLFLVAAQLWAVAR